MNTGLTSDLAVQQIMTCTPNPDDCGGYGGCSGGVEPQGFAYVADMSASGGGLLTEWMLPYESFYGIGNTTQMIMAADDDLKNPKMNVSTCDFLVPTMAPLALVTVDGYVRLPENNATALMSALATVGPLTISVDASTWSSYEGGVYDGCSYDDMDMDHAVTLVGYGTDETSGADYWLVRNSWGPTWGEGGYIRLKRDPVDDTPCGVDTQPFDGSSCWADKDTTVYPCGQCGIAFDVSYPTGVSLKTASSSA
jgi:cathepsin L